MRANAAPKDAKIAGAIDQVKKEQIPYDILGFMAYLVPNQIDVRKIFYQISQNHPETLKYNNLPRDIEPLPWRSLTSL